MNKFREVTENLYKQINKRDFKIFAIGAVVGMLSLVLITINCMIAVQRSQQATIDALNEQIASYQLAINNMEEAHTADLDGLNESMAEKDAAYEKLVSDMENESSVKIDLIQKYSYVIDKVNPKEGFTLGMLYYVDQLCKEKDLNPHMVFTIFDIESDYNIDAKSSKSTATGLGQVLAGTGKLIYEGVMGNPKGSYTHEMAKNGYTNIEIVVSYLKYLKDTYGSVKVMINGYSGDQSGAYYNNYAQLMKSIGCNPEVNHYI